MEVQIKHSNNLCVETKGACFFCLQENTISPNGKPSTNENVHHSFNISLKRFAKYLNVDFHNVFKLKIPLQGANIRTSDVIVPLCEECATLARKFTKLHHELEAVKMHLHSCVHTIQTKMVKAMDSEHDHSAIKYRKRWVMSNPVDAIQSQIFDNLRKETREKCALKLTRSLPRVKLERLRMLNIHRTNKLSMEESTDSLAKGACERKSCTKETRKDLVTSLTMPDQIESSSAVSPQNSLAQKVSNHNQPTTPNTSPTPASEIQILHRTVAHVSPQPHSEPIQPPQKTSKVTPSSFRSNPQPAPSVRYVPISSLSSSCSWSIGVDPTKINQPPTKEVEKSQEQPTESSRGSYDCVYCDEAFGDKATLRTHVVRSHCEQFFTTLKDRNLSSEEFKSIVYTLFKDVAKSHTITNGSPSKSTFNCPHCNVNHDSDGDVYAHMFRFHYTYLTSRLLSLQKESISKRVGPITPVDPGKRKEPEKRDKPNSLFSCSWCTMRYASKRSLSFHQKYNCASREEGMTNDTRTENTAQAPFPSTSSSAFQTTTPDKNVAKFHCVYCAKAFAFYYEYRVHTLTNHRVQEFSKYVSAGVTLEQVDSELKRILQTYRKVPRNENAGGCLFCPEIFSQVVDLQNHILVGHFDVVVFKLRSIIPQHTLRINETTNDSLMDSSDDDIVEIPQTTDHEDLQAPVKVDSPSLPCEALEIIMEDPLSLDAFELNSDAMVVEEEQMKMEWLFSFIDEEDGAEVQSQSQATNEEEKFFISGNNDSELILP